MSEKYDAALMAEIVKEPMVRVMRQMYSLTDRRSVVILGHGFLELLVNTLIDAKCKNAKKITANNRDCSHSANLVLLHELGLLSDESYSIFDWFRRLRNRAAHEPFFD